jgi:hypothetical protein
VLTIFRTSFLLYIYAGRKKAPGLRDVLPYEILPAAATAFQGRAPTAEFGFSDKTALAFRPLTWIGQMFAEILFC